MIQPLVTVILPAYNHEQFVEASIRGVILQDYQNIEFIIINDGSKDNTHKVISQLEQECCQRFTRFEYINRANEGLAITLNQGVLWSNASYLTVIASDDIMKPEKVSCLLQALMNAPAEVGLAYADAEFIDDAGQKISLDDKGHSCQVEQGWKTFISFYTRHRPEIQTGKNTFDYKMLLKGNFLPAMSVMWRTAILKQVGMFTPNVIIEDWDLWLRMARSSQGVYVPRIVASYRWHTGNTVKTAVVKLLKAQDIILLRELNYNANHKELRSIILVALLKNSLRLILKKEYSLGGGNILKLFFLWLKFR